MPNKFYPTLIIGLLGLFILFLIWSAFQASTQGTQVTDRDYYSKGLKYNSTMVEKRAAASLGWQVSTELRNGELYFLLHDGASQPVSGAHGILHLYSRPDSDLLKVPLEELGAGIYRVRLPHQLKGEVTVRLEIERDGARINRQLLVNI